MKFSVCRLHNELQPMTYVDQSARLKRHQPAPSIHTVKHLTLASTDRISVLERYSRRWTLRLCGVEESEKEDVRQKAIVICQAVLPEQKHRLVDTINTVHRLGPKWQSDLKPRGIILQLTSRACRDTICKAAKTAPFLRDNKPQFGEDLSKEDRERRNKLWPMIEKARKEGKATHFVGSWPFLNGSEVSLPP